MPSPSNACGECNMCCHVFEIRDLEPTKPRRTWCPHVLKGEGCSIYGDRPSSCQKFRCLWLALQDREEPPPLAARPDKSGIMLSYSGVSTWVAHVNGSLDSWKEEEATALMITGLVSKGFKVLISGEDLTGKKLLYRNYLTGEFIEEDCTLGAPDLQGIQRRMANGS